MSEPVEPDSPVVLTETPLALVVSDVQDVVMAEVQRSVWNWPVKIG